jgi:hypothetical protein
MELVLRRGCVLVQMFGREMVEVLFAKSLRPVTDERERREREEEYKKKRNKRERKKRNCNN